MSGNTKTVESNATYLFSPFELTEDPLEALVHVVKLGMKEAVNVKKGAHIAHVGGSVRGVTGCVTHTYGVKILTQRGFFSPRAYSKQKAIPSSSVSHLCISAHSNAIT